MVYEVESLDVVQFEDQEHAGGARPRSRCDKGLLRNGKSLDCAATVPRISSKGRAQTGTALACAVFLVSLDESSETALPNL